MKKRVCALAAVMALAGGGGVLADDGLELNGLVGIDYSTGQYGTGVDTNILMVPVGLRAKTGPLRLTATLPWMRVEGAANVIGGDEGGPIVVDPDAAPGEATREGWGDLSLGAAYTLPQAVTGALEVDLSARVKLPTSDEDEGLSTGETDYSVGAEASYPMGAWVPFVGVGYRMPGDPEGLDLDNTFSASLGTSYSLSESKVLTFSYDYAQASTDAVEDGHELFAGFTAPLFERVNWTIYGIAGLSDGSPDAEGGVLLSIPFH